MEVLGIQILKYDRYFQLTTSIVYLINALFFVHIKQTSRPRSPGVAI